ncbi:hypothetical protein ACI0FM_08545 [Paenochrobactrum sp. BZR 588]|uniref:hypothetical protein n=1 Tax=unclassified Paenochrobactrum TaxID=2639760 RepID=UPI003854A4E2
MHQPSVILNLKLTDRVSRRLNLSAKRLGYSPSEYAQLLFEAAFAARIGQERDIPPSDAELDEQVKCVLLLAGKTDTASMAKATGIPEARCAAILEAVRRHKRGRANK